MTNPEKIIRSSSIVLFLVIAPYAEASGPIDPIEAEARESTRILLSRNDSLSDLKQIYKVHLKKMQSNPRNPDLIKECEVFPSNCRPGNVLLFRGEGIMAQPGVSGLIRSLWQGSSYSNTSTFSDLMARLEKDVTPLKTVLSAPTAESSDPVDRVVFDEDKKSGKKRWFGEVQDPANRFPFPTNRERGSAELPYLNFKQILFTFHVNAAYLYFNDPVLGKETLLDPLISFSSNINQAMVFAVGNPQADSPHQPGRLIVISVPEKEMIGICDDKSPNAGEIWKTKECSDYLNDHEDEDEYDLVGYIKPSQIRASYSVNWEEVRQEIQNHY